MSARVHMRRHPNGLHVAAIDIPTSCGALRVTGVGSWFSDALSTASSVASRITSDPIVQAIMPPQVTAAVNAVKMISSAAQQGAPALRSVMQQFTGPGKQRLARVLHKEATRRQAVDPTAPRPRMRDEELDVAPEDRDERDAYRAAQYDEGDNDDVRGDDE